MRYCLSLPGSGRWGKIGVCLLVISQSAWGRQIQPTTREPLQPTAVQKSLQQDAGGPPDPVAAKGKGQPKVRCDEPTLEFGKIWAGLKIEHEFEIHNDGDGPLVIIDVRTTCGCQIVGEYDKTVAPGEKGRITLGLDSRNQRGTITKNILVKTNDPRQEQFSLTFHGTVAQHVAIEPPSGAIWPLMQADVDLTKQVSLRNNTGRPMTLSPVADQDTGVFEYLLEEREPGLHFMLTITARPPFAEGLNQSELRFHTGLDDAPEVSVPCRIYVPPTLQVVPPVITLAGKMARAYTRRVEVRYNGRGAMQLETAVATAAEIQVEPRVLKPGQQFQLWLTFPEGFEIPDGKTETIVVTTDIEGHEKIEIPIQGRSSHAQAVHVPERMIGKPGPRAMIPASGGGEIGFDGGDGVVTVVNFWASWCPNSRDQQRTVRELARIYGPDRVRVLQVSVDTMRSLEDVQEVALSWGLTEPVGFDPEGKLAGLYGVTSIPTLFLIGQAGVIEAVHRGALPDLMESLRPQLDLLVEGHSRQDFTLMPPRIGRLSGLSLASSTFRDRTDKGLLHLEANIIDLGVVSRATKVPFRVGYRNEGHQVLEIGGVDLSDTQNSSLERDYVKKLEPGQEGVLQGSVVTPERPGDFRYPIIIESDDPFRGRQVVQIWGTVREPVTFEPSIGLDLLQVKATGEVTLSVHAEGELLDASTSSDLLQVELQRAPDGRTAVLRVTCQAGLPAGSPTPVVRVKTSLAEAEVVEIPVRIPWLADGVGAGK